MSEENDKLRSIRFPQHLWDAIDADAHRCHRSSVKQMEAILSEYYGLGDPNLNSDRLELMRLKHKV